MVKIVSIAGRALAAVGNTATDVLVSFVGGNDSLVSFLLVVGDGAALADGTTTC